MAKKKASRRPAKKTAAKRSNATKSKTTTGKTAKPSRKARHSAPKAKEQKAVKATKSGGKTKKAAATKTPAAEPEVKQTAAAPEPAPPKSPAKRQRVTAEQMSEAQREISISEFFTKNRHLLGFDNASRALLTSVKEAVDNSLDACEEGGIAPEIIVRITEISENRFTMYVEDNGPGIVKSQIPKVFGKLLYGSKFHRLRQSRGQQGIGISAAAMYGQLTTGKAVIVTSKTGTNKPAHHYHIMIDTAANRPVITHDDVFEWEHKDHGTSVEIEMEAIYKGGRRSVDEYIQQVAVANPHVRIEYYAPAKRPVIYPRVTEQLPPETKEIKPHPYGVELGVLQRMAGTTRSRTIGGFLQAEFSRVSSTVADEICKTAKVPTDTSIKDIGRVEIEKVYRAIGETKIMSPPTNCLAPIGEEALLEGLKAVLVQRSLAEEEAKQRRKDQREGKKIKQDARTAQKIESQVEKALQEITTVAAEEPDTEQQEAAEDNEEQSAEVEGDPITKAGVVNILGKPTFITAVTRSPRVYRGNPFQVEAAVAWGGDMAGDELASVVRLANRVPLLYQQGACAMTQSVVRTNWKSYDVDQSRGALPTGPMLVLVHIASVWVPFTSEAKEAVAHYDEIITELKYALQECGRRLSRHIRRRRRAADAEKKRKYIERYIPHIGYALQDILTLTNKKRDEIIDSLTETLEQTRAV